MSKVLIILLKFYKIVLSPITTLLFGNACRFTPTCSSYTIEALEKYGAFKGLSLGFRRILRCHPWGGFGHDPV